jgi:hypothetical protein
MIKQINHYIDVDSSSDFGFTFANEEEITKPVYSSLNEQVMPLLENLARDPDKTMIKWPNRKQVIDKQISRLKSLTNV